jgi:hypothetical protein
MYHYQYYHSGCTVKIVCSIFQRLVFSGAAMMGYQPKTNGTNNSGPTDGYIEYCTTMTLYKSYIMSL